MWGALSASLEATGKYQEAITCLKRVLVSQDEVDPAEFGKIAILYDKLHKETQDSRNLTQSAYYFKKYLREFVRTEDDEISDNHFINEANLFLAQYYESTEPEVSLKYKEALDEDDFMQ
jgi:hypothetical protein